MYSFVGGSLDGVVRESPGDCALDECYSAGYDHHPRGLTVMRCQTKAGVFAGPAALPLRGRPVLSGALAVLKSHADYKAAEEERFKIGCCVGMLVEAEARDKDNGPTNQ